MDNRMRDVTFPPTGFTPNAVNTLLANALDLTAPASDALLKNRKNAWVQLAGHPGSFAPAGPHTIWKKRMQKENNETTAYQALMNDVISDVIPKFYREVEYNGDFFIEIEDLLQHFHDPSIMDIKMGTRTFLESEVKNPVLRKDLYEKMVKLDADEPTPAEHDQRAITKLRYMQFREKGSSTSSLGFRIEALRMSGQKPVSELKKIKTREQVISYINKFIHGNPVVKEKFVQRLQHITALFEKSAFFKNHEIIGSSLLLMHDKQDKAGIWMIDFAKTLRVEQRNLTHRTPWAVGNHEDGYLTGMDHLTKIMQDLPSEEELPSDGGVRIARNDSTVNVNIHTPDTEERSKISPDSEKQPISPTSMSHSKHSSTASSPSLTAKADTHPGQTAQIDTSTSQTAQVPQTQAQSDTTTGQTDLQESQTQNDNLAPQSSLQTGANAIDSKLSSDKSSNQEGNITGDVEKNTNVQNDVTTKKQNNLSAAASMTSLPTSVPPSVESESKSVLSASASDAAVTSQSVPATLQPASVTSPPESVTSQPVSITNSPTSSDKDANDVTSHTSEDHGGDGES